MYQDELLTYLNNSDSLESLSSSVLDYEYKNGRRYATYGSNQYILPNDEVSHPLPLARRKVVPYDILQVKLGDSLIDCLARMQPSRPVTAYLWAAVRRATSLRTCNEPEEDFRHRYWNWHLGNRRGHVKYFLVSFGLF